MTELRRRAAVQLRRWPRALALAVHRSQERPRPSPPRRGRRLRLPTWMLVPRALDAAYRSRGSRPGRSFLDDVLWGQYCLFQCIRLQDDVFDGHTADRALVYVSDQFLVEADRAFARHFPRSSRFWEAFRGALESTTRAIVQVDELQKRVGCDPARLAREYAKVGAVLEVGAAAVCLEYRRARDLGALGRFADEYAIGDQILDDLEDVEDDLRRRRFNYVAQRICAGRPVSSDPESARPEIARALAREDGAALVLGDARRHFERAAVTAARLRIPAISALAAAGLRSVEGLGRALHRAQVRVVLAPVLAGAQR